MKKCHLQFPEQVFRFNSNKFADLFVQIPLGGVQRTGSSHGQVWHRSSFHILRGGNRGTIQPLSAGLAYGHL